MRGPAGASDRTCSFPFRATPLLAVLALLSACAGGVIPHTTGAPPSRPSQAAKPVPSTPRPPVTPAPVVPGENALGAGLPPGPSVSDILRQNERTRAALSAFRASCPALMRRNDTTGLTRGQDWAFQVPDYAVAALAKPMSDFAKKPDKASKT